MILKNIRCCAEDAELNFKLILAPAGTMPLRRGNLGRETEPPRKQPWLQAGRGRGRR
ncbi:MAG: hypothetical protein OXC26_21950 [Albidovulum sp.]|nr:hypothetical protein [Albidovulum sp.]